jgi:hypothetical protein
MTKGRGALSVGLGLWMKGTADPSASLGMTKVRVALSVGMDLWMKEQQVPAVSFLPI